jgi:excisionase family DNA binding protein
MKPTMFLTTAEVLEALRVTRRTLYRLVHAGQIPAVRIGRQWRFRREDLEVWLGGRRAARPTSVPSGSISAPAAASPPRTRRLLVVDDDPDVRSVLKHTLGLSLYHVDLAADGTAAIEQLRREPYDLVIVDLRLPGVDGMTVIRTAKQVSPTIGIVIITGFSSEASAIEAIELGVNGYLAKPFRIARVLATVAKVLEAKSSP